MPSPTPPADPFDHKPAHDWADATMARLGQTDEPVRWKGIRWSMVEAYMAGRAAGVAEEREACAKRVDAFAESWANFPDDKFFGREMQTTTECVADKIRRGT